LALTSLIAFYPYVIRYEDGVNDNFYSKGHSYGAIRALWKTKVLIEDNIIGIDNNGYADVFTWIRFYTNSVANAELALRDAMPYRGIVLEVGKEGSATVQGNTIKYHHVGVLNNGWDTNSYIGGTAAGDGNTISECYIGIGNGPQTKVKIVGNSTAYGGSIGANTATGGNRVAIMDVGAFSTIQNNNIYVRAPRWSSASTNNIGISSIDSHYNYNYDHESSVDEFRLDMPESQDIASFGGTLAGDKNTIDVALSMTALSFYEFGTIGVPAGGLGAGQSFSLGLDKTNILLNQTLSGLGASWTAPVEHMVGAGQTYTQIQPAVDAASPGEVVIVKPGTYNGHINNLFGIHVLAEKMVKDEDDVSFPTDSLIDGADGYPDAGIGGWSLTILSGGNVSYNKWGDGFDSGTVGVTPAGWSIYQGDGAANTWQWNNATVEARNVGNGFSVMYNTSPKANTGRFVNFRFNIKTTGAKRNAYAVMRYGTSGPDFGYFGVELETVNPFRYRFVKRKCIGGKLYDSATTPCADCAGAFSDWRDDGIVTTDKWYTMSIQTASPGVFIVEISTDDTTIPNNDNNPGGWKTVFSRAFFEDGRWPATTEAAGLMTVDSDTDFDSFNWRAGPLVVANDMTMFSGFTLNDFRYQAGSAAFGVRSVSPLIKANTVYPGGTSGTTSAGIGMACGAKPALIGNKIENTYVSISTSDQGSTSYGAVVMQEEDYYGAGKNTQPLNGGMVPNDIWSGPYIYFNFSKGGNSANYRIWPYCYGWAERNYLTGNVGGSVNNSLINMVQGTEKFRGNMEITWTNNWLYENHSGHADGAGGQGVWSDNQDSNMTYPNAIFDGNYFYGLGVGFWSKRGGRDLIFRNNWLHSSAWGFRFHNNTDGFVHTNKIYNNADRALATAEQFARITATYNVCEDNFTGFGLGGWGGSLGNYIAGCDMINNAFAGISIVTGGNSRYTRNNYANNLTGLFVENGAWAIVANNTFLHNTMAASRIRGTVGGVRYRRNTVVGGNWSNRGEAYSFPGIMITPSDTGIGENPELIVGNIFFENSLGVMLVDGSTSGQVSDNIVLGWDPYFDIFDGNNDGFWEVSEGSSFFGSNFSRDTYPDPRFMDDKLSEPSIDDYRLDPGPSYGIRGAVDRSPLLDVAPVHPGQLGGTGIGMRIDPGYVAFCWVGPNGYPDDLGPDLTPGTEDDYSSIDDVEEIRMGAGDIYSYPGSGSMSYSNDMNERYFNLYPYRSVKKSKTDVGRFVSGNKQVNLPGGGTETHKSIYYFKVVESGTRTLNIDNVRIPYYEKDDLGDPVSINGDFENSTGSGSTYVAGNAADFTGWVEVDGNEKGGSKPYIITGSTWTTGLKGNYCIGTSGTAGMSATENEMAKTIIFRTVPFRIDVRKGTKLWFNIGGDGGFSFLAPNFRYNHPNADKTLGVSLSEPHYGEPMVSPNTQIRLNIVSGDAEKSRTVGVRLSSVKIYVNFDDPDSVYAYDNSTYTYTPGAGDWLIYDGAADTGATNVYTYTPANYTSGSYGIFSGKTTRRKISENSDVHNAQFVFTLDRSPTGSNLLPTWPMGKMIRIVANAVGEEGRGSLNGPLKLYSFYTAKNEGGGKRGYLLRFNAGGYEKGEAVTTQGLNSESSYDWMNDMSFLDGYEYTNHWGFVNGVPTTGNPIYYKPNNMPTISNAPTALYMKQMAGSLRYRFRLPAGTHNLKLYFAETNLGQCGPLRDRSFELKLAEGSDTGQFHWDDVNTTTDPDAGCVYSPFSSTAFTRSRSVNIPNPGATRDDFYTPMPELLDLIFDPYDDNDGYSVAAIEVSSQTGGLVDVTPPSVYYKFPDSGTHGPSAEGMVFRIRDLGSGSDPGVGINPGDINLQVDTGGGYNVISPADITFTRLVSPFNEHDMTFNYIPALTFVGGKATVNVKLDAVDKLGNAMTQVAWSYTAYESSNTIPYLDNITLYDVDSASTSWTNNINVQVSLEADSGVQPDWMCFADTSSNLVNCGGSITWQLFRRTSTQSITPGDGSGKELWCKLGAGEDTASPGKPDPGQISIVKIPEDSSTIGLDTVPPSLTVSVASSTPADVSTGVVDGTALVPSITSASDTTSLLPTAAYEFEIGTSCYRPSTTNTGACSVAADDIVASLAVSGWQSGTTWIPTLVNNTTYYWRIKLRDNAGNETKGPYMSFSTSTAGNTQLFSLSSITLKGTYGGSNTGYTEDFVSEPVNRMVEISFNISGSGVPTKMLASETATDLDSPGYDTNYIDFSPSYMFALSSGDGTKTVYVRLYNSGHQDVRGYANIELDTTSPTGLSLVSPPDANDTYPGVMPVLLAQPATDMGVGMGEYFFQQASDSLYTKDLQESGWITSNSWTVATPLRDSQEIWYWRVKARDLAGNESSYSANNTVGDVIQGKWRLVGGSPSSWSDDSTNANHLNATGAPPTTTGHGGGANLALSLTKLSNQYLSKAAPTGLDFNGSNLTISAWIYPTDASGGSGREGIVTKYNETGNQRGYALYLNNANYFFDLSSDGTSVATVQGTTTLAQNTWYHIAAVYNGVDMRLYLDGVLDCSPTVYSSGIFNNSASFMIGALNEGADFFDGRIDDVAVWGTNLSASKIYRYYTYLDDFAPPDSEVYYDDFNNNSANTNWKIINGEWNIESGSFSGEGRRRGTALLRDNPKGTSSSQNRLVEVSATAMEGGERRNAFVVFSHKNPYFFFYAGCRVYWGTSSYWTIGYYASGKWYDLVKSRENIDQDRSYRIGVTVQGDSVTLYVDGVTKVRYTFSSTNLSWFRHDDLLGRVGLMIDSAHTHFDAFRILDIGEGALLLDTLDIFDNNLLFSDYTDGLSSLYFTLIGGSPSSYMVSQDSGFSGASWQTYYSSPVLYTVTGLDKETTVYFKVKNSTGEESNVLNNIIRLDTTAPNASSISSPTDDPTFLSALERDQGVTMATATDPNLTDAKPGSGLDPSGGYRLELSQGDGTFSSSVVGDKWDSTTSRNVTLMPGELYYARTTTKDKLQNTGSPSASSRFVVKGGVAYKNNFDTFTDLTDGISNVTGSGFWNFSSGSKSIDVVASTSNVDFIVNNSLGLNRSIGAQIYFKDSGNKRCYIILSYISITDFWYAGLDGSQEKWVIGHYSTGGYSDLATAVAVISYLQNGYSDPFDMRTDYYTETLSSGPFTVNLFANGVNVLSYNTELPRGYAGFGAESGSGGTCAFDSVYICDAGVNTVITPKKGGSIAMSTFDTVDQTYTGLPYPWKKDGALTGATYVDSTDTTDTAGGEVFEGTSSWKNWNNSANNQIARYDMDTFRYTLEEYPYMSVAYRVPANAGTDSSYKEWLLMRVVVSDQNDGTGTKKTICLGAGNWGKGAGFADQGCWKTGDSNDGADSLADIELADDKITSPFGFIADGTWYQYNIDLKKEITDIWPSAKMVTNVEIGDHGSMTSPYSLSSWAQGGGFISDSMQMYYSPDPVRALSVIIGNNLTVTWTNPSNSRKTIVLRSTGTYPDTAPSDGLIYNVGDIIGTAEVRCVVTNDYTVQTDTRVVKWNDLAGACVDTEVTEGTTYYYAAYAYTDYGVPAVYHYSRVGSDSKSYGSPVLVEWVQTSWHQGLPADPQATNWPSNTTSTLIPSQYFYKNDFVSHSTVGQLTPTNNFFVDNDTLVMYHLENATGNIIDSSSYGNDATSSFDGTGPSGIRAVSYGVMNTKSFRHQYTGNGNGSNIVSNGNIGPTLYLNNVTAEGWFKPRSDERDSRPGILLSHRGYCSGCGTFLNGITNWTMTITSKSDYGDTILMVRAMFKTWFDVYPVVSSTLFSANRINLSYDEWHHFAFTWGGVSGSRVLRLYIDGIEVGKSTAYASNSMRYTNEPLYSGRRGASNSGHVTQQVDELRLSKTIRVPSGFAIWPGSVDSYMSTAEAAGVTTSLVYNTPVSPCRQFSTLSWTDDGSGTDSLYMQIRVGDEFNTGTTSDVYNSQWYGASAVQGAYFTSSGQAVNLTGKYIQYKAFFPMFSSPSLLDVTVEYTSGTGCAP